MDEATTPGREPTQQLDGVNGGAKASPEPEPEPQDGASPNIDPLPVGKLKVPDDTNGQYVVLYAQKPKRGHRALYQEVACVKAHDGAQAKRIVLGEDGRSPKPVDERDAVAKWLLAAAAVDRGILLRAVPAMHWPGEVEPTTYVRPAPVLQIG